MSSSRNTSSSALFEELEPRLLLSADGLGGLDALVSSDERELDDTSAQMLPAYQEFSPLQAGPATPASSEVADRRQELVFVDGGIEDYETLVAGFLAADSDQRAIQVVVLDPTRDGIAQITDVLAGYDGLDAVHVVSHGDDASLRLGNTTLDGESLARYREAIAGWAGALDSEADLLLYGCNLAASEDGRALTSALAVLTSADVASSDDLTGSAKLGGDWALEFTAGAIETEVGPSAEAQVQWSGVLAAPAEDSFEGYPVGPIGGNGGGSGWAAGSWSSPSVYDINVVASGLTHPTGGPGADTAAVELDAQDHAFNFATYSARELVAPLGAATETVWASFLLEPADTNPGSYFGIGLGNGSSFNTSTQMFAGYKGSNFILENVGGGLSHNAPGAATGVTTFLVLKLELSAGGGIDTATLYVNPTAGLTNPEPATAQVVKSDMSVTNLTHIALIGGTDEAANTARIDQLRFGSTYESVAPPNIAPTASDNTVATDEDTSYVFSAADFNFSDVDAGDTLQQVQITSLPSTGTLKLSGADVTVNQVIAVADIDASNLTFTPQPDENGTGYDSFQFKVSDGVSLGAPGTVLTSFAAPAVSAMSSLAFDGTNLWLTDSNTSTVYELDTAGTVLSSFAAPGSGDVSGVTFDGTNLWVVDRGGNTVYEMTTAGAVVSSFATPDTDARGITWDGTNLWLIVGGDVKVYELTTAGAEVSSFAWPDDYLRDLAWDGTNLWVTDSNDALLRELNTAGTALSSTPAPGTGAAGIAFDGREFWHADTDVDDIYQLTGSNSTYYSAVAYTMTVDVTPVDDDPVDLAIIKTLGGGLSLNEDGGNDAYFVADSGLTSPLSRFTLEVQFTATSPSDTTPFLSYNTASGDELSLNTVAGTNALELDFGTGADARSTAIDYDAALLDGQRHTLSTTWDNAAGDWQIFIDGVLIDSGTGLSAGTTIQTGGALIFGQEQDAVGGGFDATQYFSGTLYDARLFDDLRSAAEIDANLNRTVAYDEGNLVANWLFDDLSVDGVVTETVAGNNLSLAHASGAGFSASTPVLTLAVSEAAATGTSVGRVSGTDADREALITSLLAADPDLVYSAETGKFYKLVNTKLDWDVASTTAQATALNAVNGQLASIQSATEQEILGNLSAAFGSSAWIGATDQTTEGEWRWVDGGAQASQFWQGDWTGDNVDDAYANWEAGQPDNAGATQHYLALQADGAWNDGEINKADVLGYLVEWDADEVLDATDALLYSIQSQTVAGAFTVDSDSGTITVADGSLLDYATNASHTLTVRVTDSTGGIHDEAFTTSLSSASSLWLTTEDDVGSPSGASGLDSWTGGEVLSFDDPAFNPGSTSGTLNRLFNLDDFVQDGDVRVDSIHYVGTDMTVGSNAIQLRQGDVLLSSVLPETLVNSDASTLAVTSRDVFVYRPDSLADYSLGGSFIKLINGADLSIETEGITLVESSTTIGAGGGATTVNAGDLLLTDRDNPGLIYRLQPGVLGDAATNTGTLTVLADVRDVGVNQAIHGVELVEHDTVVGDRTLMAGQILVSLYVDDTVAGTPVSRADIFILDVTTTGDTTIATADPFFTGGDIGFDSWQESPWGISLLSTASPYNDAPTFGATLDGAPSFTEDNPAVVLDADVIVSDVELDALNAGLGNYAGASLTLARNGGADAEDVLNFNDGNGITLVAGNLIKNSQVVASFDTTTTLGELVITFTDVNGETPTSTDIVNILRQITYSNSSNTPPASSQIDWIFDDGNAGEQGIGGPLQVGGSTTVTITPTDDALSVSTTGNTVLFTEDAGATTALFTAAMDTVEAGDTVTQVILTLANVEAGDTLTFGATSIDLNSNAATGPDANGFSYTVSSAGATPVVTISHAGASDTLSNTMLNSLVFNNNSNNDPSTTTRTVTLTSVTDSGSGLTADGTVATVNVAKADDALLVSTTGNTVLFTEDAGATTALFAASMDTVETGDSVTQVILTLANVEAGDTLSFGATSVDLNTNAATGPDANGFTYTVSSAGATPVVTISHAGASDTQTNTMLNSLVFNNTANDDPGTTARTVTLTSVTDSGSGLTNDGTVATVNVAKADDPINVATTGSTVLFTEDAGATTALFAASMDTVETGDTVTQVILTLANVEAGDTLTFGATSVDLNTNGATGPDGNGFTYTVSSSGATPVVTISHAGATDTLTNTMLNSLVFNNTANNDPSTTARTVTLTSVTDSGSGLTNDGTVATVNVAKADDALAVSTTGNTVLFTEDAGATTALFAASMDTVETGDTVTQVVLTLANVEAGDTLVSGATSVDLNTNAATGPDANGFTYTVSSAGATPVVTISHAGATDTLTNTMLNSLVFNNTSNDDPSTTARTVTLTSVTDSGSDLTNDGTVATVNVAKADDALAVSTTGNTVLFTEGGGATTALFAASMDTVETGDTVTQIVLTLANVEAGDTVVFGATSVDLNTNAATGPDANGFTYTVSSAGASPVVTISHAGASDTLTNTMLNSLIFNNTANNDPSTTARTVTLTSATDSGSGLTNDGTVATVNVALDDDALVVSTTGNTVLFTEDAGATSALFAASMDTVEAGDTVTQVILTLANVEAGDTLVFGATSVDLNTNAATGPDANGFTYTVSSAGATPVVTISHAGATDTLTNTMLNSLVFNNTSNDDPGTTARTVTLTSVTDSGSGLTNDGTVATVNVAKADDALSVSTTGNTVLFTEDAGATTALFAASMDTVETGDAVTQVVLTLANVEAGDTLTFGATSVDLNANGATGPDANGFTYTVSSAGTTPVVTIGHAGATDTLTNTMLNSLVFNNTANNDPSTTARTVTLTSITDSGSGLTNDGTVATVNVAKADDALVVSTTGNTVLFTEDAGATTALFAASMDTVETGDTVTQVILTLANVEAGDTLVFGATSVDLNTNAATGPDGNGFTYTVSSAGATPVVTISHAGATDTLTNTMLNSLVFNNTANNDPSTTARTVTLTSVTDSGSGLTNDGTVATVNVAKADDALVVSTTGNTVLFTEDAGATTALFAASMDTVETGDTVTQVILTLANVEAGDTLVFGATSVDLNTNAATGPDGNGFTYTVSSAGATPVVTITHAGATDTLTNTMLNSLLFNNTANNDPSTTARTVTLTSVTDSGSGLTNDGTVATVNVAKADDALVVSTTGNTVLFTEDAGATTALFAASMDTVETGDTVTQVILTLANVEAGDTLVFGATSVDLNTNAATGPDANGFTYTVSSAGATPVVTISHAGATDTLTNTMLNSLVFNNTTNNDPSTTARTVTLTSVTDSGSGLTNDGTVATVNVAKADDALLVSTTGNTVLFTEDAGATSALFAASMDTVETGDTVTQVILTLANVEAGDTLSFAATSIDLNTDAATGPDANGFTYTVSSAGASPVVTISHAGATDTLTNTMLNSLVFNNTSNNDPSTTARTVTLTSVTDSGSGLTNDGTVATVNVAKADDALLVSTTGNTVLFTEDAGATSALFAASMDTVETGDTVTQVILTLANVEAGDTLLFGGTSVDLNTDAATGPDANGFTYTVSSAGASPVVTISHAGATDTQTNTMLNSLVFNNTANNDPGTTARTVTLTSVTDSGSGLTNDGTVATVNVAKADDGLVVSTTGNTVLFTEDAGATTALFAASMDTVETGDTVTQVILTLANVEAGDTLTFGATSIDLNTNAATGPDANGFTYTVSSAGASPVVTISHAGATDTQTNTMLNSLVFNNTANNDPSTTARTVTLTSVTDSGSGLTNDGTVAIVNVAKADDALNVATTGNTVLFTEDAGATTALFAASMDTVETGDTVTQVILTLANVEAGDTLTFGATSIDLNTNAATGPDGNGFTYTVSSAGATPVVTISHAGATDTLTNTMLNSLVFNNTANDDPGTTARTVTLTSVTDSGSGLTNDGTVATVNVAKADDPLVVSTTGNTVLFTEGAGASSALFAASMDTVEAGDTVTQVILTLANVEAGDTLTFGATSIDLNTNAATGPDANGFTYTVSSAGTTPVVTISHAGATDTLTNTMLNSLVFNNTTNNDPSTTARTVTLTSVTDSGSGLTNDGTVATVNVAKTNDAPTVNLINVVTSLPETTSTATAIKIADIVVTDVDAGTNNLTLAGADLAHFEIVGTELRLRAGTSLDFEIPADADMNHVFDVTVVVDDPGAGGTPDDTAATTLTVTDVNENPGGAGTLTTTNLNDDAGATNLFVGLTVSDPDTGENDLSVTITLTNPPAGTISGGGFTDLGGGVYQATGLTVSQADTALDNATFAPTDGTGPSGTFTTDITLTVNDQGGGGEQSVLSATTVTITRVNTAPSGLPGIFGVPVETLVLTATTDDISDADGLGTFSFQWLRDGVPIATAIDSSYTLVGEDRGTNIAVQVEFIDGNGATERVTSVAVGPVSEPPAPEPKPESEDLPPAADTLEKVDTPPPLDEVELSAVLPVTEDLVVAGNPQATQATPRGEPLIIEPQFLSQITQLLDAAAADSTSSAKSVARGPVPLVDAQFLLRDRVFEPMATETRPISDSSYESSARQALIAGVQDMQNTMAASGDSRIEAEEFRQTVIQGTLGTLSVGSVTWLLRAGSLLASVFSSIPMWSTMDPLPVLDVSAKERKRRLKATSNAGDDDASEQRMDEILERGDRRSDSRDSAS